MKIVIEIDENLYTRLFDNGVDNYDDAVDMAKAIRNGTPLPKGHGRLIDGDRFKADNPQIMEGNVFFVTENPLGKIIDNAPTIIEAEKG